jgi:nitrite reductase/ring-hydroxylating ferredoxin subunit
MLALYGSSSNQSKGVADGIPLFSASFAAEAGRYKLSELMLFFARYKAGRYDKSFSTFDCRRIGNSFFREFLPDRTDELYRIETHPLGANNGIIIGCSNFQGHVAWDRQCPNCITQYGGTNYPLELNGIRQSVMCKKCKRTYSLETGAITEGAKGEALMRYGIDYKGLGTPVSVGN